MSFFDNFFPSKTITTSDNHSTDIIMYIIKNNVNSLKRLLSSRMNIRLKDVQDNYNNNLLHIAGSFNVSKEMIRFLFESQHQIDQQQKNIKGLTPLECAVSAHNQTYINEYINIHIHTMDQTENLQMIRHLETVNSNLDQRNKELTTEVSILRHNNKRLRDDNDFLSCSNKDLMDKNKQLKLSIDNLTKINRK